MYLHKYLEIIIGDIHDISLQVDLQISRNNDAEVPG